MLLFTCNTGVAAVLDGILGVAEFGLVDFVELDEFIVGSLHDEPEALNHCVLLEVAAERGKAVYKIDEKIAENSHDFLEVTRRYIDFIAFFAEFVDLHHDIQCLGKSYGVVGTRQWFDTFFCVVVVVFLQKGLDFFEDRLEIEHLLQSVKGDRFLTAVKIPFPQQTPDEFVEDFVEQDCF